MGDVHGQLDRMYRDVSDIEKARGINIDAICQLGDFQAIRNEEDLNHLRMPLRHRKTGDFPRYYQDSCVPKRTLFIGGNHENDVWISQHPEGTKLIRDLSYLGRSGTMDVGGVKVGWISGNYSPVEYSSAGRKKYCHFTAEDIDKIWARDIDILLLHDWPSIRALQKHVVESSVSDSAAFEYAIRRDWGSSPLYELLCQVKPHYVFCGHMHVPLKLEARIGDSTVKFVSLARVGDKDAIGVLDTNNFNFLTYDFRDNTNLLDILPDSEKSKVGIAFSLLENGQIPDARKMLEDLLSQGASSDARSFCHYGLAVAQMNLTAQKSLGLNEVDNVLSHLRLAVNGPAYTDLYLVLGTALRNKVDFLLEQKQTRQRDSEIIALCDEAVSVFDKSGQLNNGTMPELTDNVNHLIRIRDSLNGNFARMN